MSREESAPEAPLVARPTWVRAVIVVNLTAGVLLWFFYVTDYSWAGTIPDVLFAPIVGLVAWLSWLVLHRSGASKNGRPYLRALLPSLVGGGLPLLLAVVMWIPPFTLGAFFYVDEVINEQVLQREVSPDGHMIATVTFRGVGAYGSGNGRVSVQVSRRGLPLLERQVYYEGRSYTDRDTHTYLKWNDSKSFEVVGEPEKKQFTVRISSLQF